MTSPDAPRTRLDDAGRGALRLSAAVRANESVAHDLYRLTLRLPSSWGPPLPGQYVALTLERRWSESQSGDAGHALLRRPFGIAAYRRTAQAAEMELLYTPLGKVTGRMTALAAGDDVDLLGPLGSAFPLDGEGRLTLVAGGRGIGPLLFVAAERARRGPFTLIYGARSAAELLSLPRWPGAQVIRATDDGSDGICGTAAQVLQDLAAEEGRRVLACGPPGMLDAVAQECRRRGWPCWVAVEEIFGCGLGLCGSCAIPARDPADDYARYLWACQEGPVLAAERIDWEIWRARWS